MKHFRRATAPTLELADPLFAWIAVIWSVQRLLSEMPVRVMIVEDEILVAANLEATIEDLGYEPIGIAPDMDTAMSLAHAHPDLALVDLNLRDGETGALIGARLSCDHGIVVLFLTANPRSLGAGVPGTFGVVAKPYDEGVISEVIEYALKRKEGARVTPPPYLTEFNLAPLAGTQTRAG